jgi:hypothetical protein
MNMPADKFSSNTIKKLSKIREHYEETNNSQHEKIKVMTPEEIARHYHIPTGSLANLRCKKIGPPYYRVYRRIFYRVDQFEKWFFSTPVLTKDAIDLDLTR